MIVLGAILSAPLPLQQSAGAVLSAVSQFVENDLLSLRFGRFESGCCRGVDWLGETADESREPESSRVICYVPTCIG